MQVRRGRALSSPAPSSSPCWAGAGYSDVGAAAIRSRKQWTGVPRERPRPPTRRCRSCRRRVRRRRSGWDTSAVVLKPKGSVSKTTPGSSRAATLRRASRQYTGTAGKVTVCQVGVSLLDRCLPRLPPRRTHRPPPDQALPGAQKAPSGQGDRMGPLPRRSSAGRAAGYRRPVEAGVVRGAPRLSRSSRRCTTCRPGRGARPARSRTRCGVRCSRRSGRGT